MNRWAVVVAAAPTGCPPGVDPDAFVRACTSDVLELCAGLSGVDVALAGADPVAVGWPRTPELPLTRGGAGSGVGRLLEGLNGLGADQGVVVAGDAPDLPPLLLGKLFSALSSADVAVTPAARGGLVALAARLPLPGWLAALVDLSLTGGVDELVAAAPRRGCVAVGPGWHRLSTPADLARIDPDLEGWDALRVLLSAPHR